MSLVFTAAEAAACTALYFGREISGEQSLSTRDYRPARNMAELWQALEQGPLQDAQGKQHLAGARIPLVAATWLLYSLPDDMPLGTTPFLEAAIAEQPDLRERAQAFFRGERVPVQATGKAVRLVTAVNPSRVARAATGTDAAAAAAAVPAVKMAAAAALICAANAGRKVARLSAYPAVRSMQALAESLADKPWVRSQERLMLALWHSNIWRHYVVPLAIAIQVVQLIPDDLPLHCPSCEMALEKNPDLPERIEAFLAGRQVPLSGLRSV